MPWGANVIGNGKTTVTLVMIVRNEEQQLAACLTPVAALFDEIVIVDTGSRDATKQIARQFAPQVFEFPWCDDFSAARNECLRHAKGDWVFWLDADDRLSAENLEKLKRLLGGLGDERRVHLMDTVCWSEFVSDGSTLISHPRLFRRIENLQWTGRVHEQLRLPPGEDAIDAVWSDVRIDHLGYQDRATQQRKLQRNMRLLRMDYAINPDDESTLLHLGMAYFHLGRWSDADTCLRQLLSAAKKAGDHLRQVYASLAHIALKQGKVAESLATLAQGLAAFPDDEYLQFLRAECFYEVDDYPAARATLLKVIQASRQPAYHGGVPAEVKEHLAPRRLADVLRLENDFVRAEALCRSLVAQFPRDAHVWHTLGRIYLDCGKQNELLKVVEQLRACPEGNIFAALLLALWHLSRREVALAGEQIDWLIAHAPQMPLPRMLRVELLNQTGAATDERIKACRDVLRLQPGNLDVQRVLLGLESAQHAVAQPAGAKASQWPTLILGAGFASGVTAAQ
jgi:glycosyltransferase involved in cell wall biosynthesis